MKSNSIKLSLHRKVAVMLNLNVDSRNKNRAETSSISTRDDKSTSKMTTTEVEANLLREEIVKLIQVQTQYYLNVVKDKDRTANHELALIKARTEAARLKTAWEEYSFIYEHARLIDLTQAQNLAAQTAVTAQFTADQAALTAIALAEQVAKRPKQWKLGADQINFSDKSSETNTIRQGVLNTEDLSKSIKEKEQVKLISLDLTNDKLDYPVEQSQSTI